MLGSDDFGMCLSLRRYSLDLFTTTFRIEVSTTVMFDIPNAKRYDSMCLMLIVTS